MATALTIKPPLLSHLCLSGTTGLEDVTLHPIVDGNSFSESQSIVFVPPDNIQVEVMKYRIHDKNSISAPFLVKSSTRENNPNKTIGNFFPLTKCHFSPLNFLSMQSLRFLFHLFLPDQ